MRSIGFSTLKYAVEEDHEDWKEMADNILVTLREKLQELLQALQNFAAYLLTSFDKIFPPETRDDQIHHWLHTAKPYLIVAVVAMAVFFLFKCCCSRGRSSVKMMKAPGRNFRMPRSRFEANPRGYFRDLRVNCSRSPSHNFLV